LKNGYLTAAFVIFVVNIGWPIGDLLDGRPVVPGRFTAIYYGVVVTVCALLLFIGIKRASKGYGGRN